jgi:hypothetical protein
MKCRQQGLVVVMYAVALAAVLGVAGLAVDLGRAYLEKTRLQNVLDAAALDAAKTLFDTGSTSSAQTAAAASLAANGFASLAPTYTFTPAGLNPKYVHLQVSGYTVTTVLARVIGYDTLSLTVEAKAGPLSLGGEVCGAPIGVCGDPTHADDDCTDGACWGIPTVAGQFALKDAQSGPGFYGLLQTPPGAAGINAALSGEKPKCVEAGKTETAQGGFIGSNTDALNSRFGTASGLYGNASKYPPDAVTSPASIPMLYSVYQARLASGSWDYPNGVPRRRTFVVPIIDCDGVGASKPVAVLGTACLFMTRDVPGSGVDKGTVYGQLIDQCTAEGGTPGAPGSSGAYRIVLFQAGTQS